MFTFVHIPGARIVIRPAASNRLEDTHMPDEPVMELAMTLTRICRRELLLR